MRTILASTAAALLLSVGAVQAHAGDLIPYPNSGAYNATSYSFKATNDGDIIAYFAGADAGFDNQIGLLINGTPSPNGFGLDDHATAIGTPFDLGTVHQNDVLTFVLDIVSSGDTKVYSDPSLNVAYDGAGAPGDNHIYSTEYTGSGPAIFSGVPAGTFVAFEDEPLNSSDLDYNDETFVFTNTSPAIIEGGPGGIPEPSTWALMLAGLGAVGAAMRSRRSKQLVVTAA
jgi:hypothetical protein